MTMTAEPPVTLPDPYANLSDLQRRSLALLSRTDKYIVSVDEYTAFRRDGFLICRNVVSPDQIEEFKQHTLDLMHGNLPEQQNVPVLDHRPDSGVDTQPLARPPAHLSPEEKADFWLRTFMLHRHIPLHEKYLLHPRVLDILEAIIGPDILAMQSMLFLKGPGKPGQGFHQDSYYIPTYPDSLCGAWIALDDVDEENGCMYFTKGSQNEPIYPPVKSGAFGDAALKGIEHVDNVSHTDDTINDLTKIVRRKYGVTARGVNETPAIMNAGDVAFFGGHVFHRSFTNISKTRFRRSFVGHYSNARGYTDWAANHEENKPHVDPLTGSTNAAHILARGDTHMPFAKPRFNTPCAALIPAHIRRQFRRPGVSMMGQSTNTMAPTPHGPPDHK